MCLSPLFFVHGVAGYREHVNTKEVSNSSTAYWCVEQLIEIRRTTQHLNFLFDDICLHAAFADRVIVCSRLVSIESVALYSFKYKSVYKLFTLIRFRFFVFIHSKRKSLVRTYDRRQIKPL